jgi:hypothetical protein
MKKSLITLPIVVMIFAVGCAVVCSKKNTESAVKPEWQEDFGISDRSLSTTGRNQYFILEPGFQLTLESEDEKLVVTVLDETRDVNGVETRVVEEREWKNGNLAEVSRNFFAICNETKDVFYFGEEVDVYKQGKVVSHGGAWLAGSDNARAGLMIPGTPVLGMKYFQEIAPCVAMDRAEVMSVDETFTTPAGVFKNCLKTKEGTSLNPNEKEYKRYAPGIGLIQDGDLLLTGHGFLKSK